MNEELDQWVKEEDRKRYFKHTEALESAGFKEGCDAMHGKLFPEIQRLTKENEELKSLLEKNKMS